MLNLTSSTYHKQKLDKDYLVIKYMFTGRERGSKSIVESLHDQEQDIKKEYSFKVKEKGRTQSTKRRHAQFSAAENTVMAQLFFARYTEKIT